MNRRIAVVIAATVVSAALVGCGSEKVRSADADAAAPAGSEAAVEVPEILQESWDTMTDSEKQGFCGDFDARGAEGVREIINDTMGYELVAAEDAEAIFTELCAGV